MGNELKGLDYIYITNVPEIAQIAEKNNVKYIMVDMEYIGKEDRQSGYDSVKNRHSFGDIQRMKGCLTRSKVLVRCNPIHGESAAYVSSEEEIGQIIEGGADIVMLPYFKTMGEVRSFLQVVGKHKVEKWLLVETPQAAEQIDGILGLDGIDAVHIGLNDLSLGYHKKFMFELLADGTIESLCSKLKKKGMEFGFGGVAALGQGIIPAEYVLGEHYRLGSCRAILSRTFCNYEKAGGLDEIEKIFSVELEKIRDYEEALKHKSAAWFAENSSRLKQKIEEYAN